MLTASYSCILSQRVEEGLEWVEEVVKVKGRLLEVEGWREERSSESVVHRLCSPTVLGKLVNPSVLARGTATIHLTPKTVRPAFASHPPYWMDPFSSRVGLVQGPSWLDVLCIELL